MKKVVLTSLGAILLATAANAGWYVGGYVTTTQDEDVSLYKSATLDASVGYAFSGGIRVEADVLTLNLWDGEDHPTINFDLQVGNWENQTMMFKGLYDIKLDGPVTPYVGVGINPFGLSYQYDSDSERSVTDMTILGALIGGVSYAVNDKISLDLQYSRVFFYNWKRTALGSSSTSGSNSKGSDLVKLGVRYNF